MQRYNPKEIEPKWQQTWDEQGLYEAKDFDDKSKFVMLTEFPYPSGDGLHMGHIREYTYGDILARQKRMQGRNVLYPMGFDEFGLPTENYAIKNKVTPQNATATNVATFEKQMKSLGLGFDWSRKVNTSDPKYYKWTQWLFLQFFKAGLAYQDEIAINWCPYCKTGLSNEEVVNGRHERCDTIVEKKLLKQWVLKITAYAERLLEGLKHVDYPSRIADQQVNWIGRSEGAEIDFVVDEPADYVLLHGFTATPQSDFLPNFVKKLQALKCKVFVPKLPNTDHPSVMEQVKFVQDNYDFTEQTILLGHSLGSVVALKVAEQLKIPIKRLVLVAGFAQPGFPDKKRPFEDTFDWQFDFEKIKHNAKEIVILRADQDIPVLPERADYLSEKLGVPVTDFIAEDNHATGVTEPEVWRHTIKTVPVFTTRADTIFSAAFIVVAPEHELVQKVMTEEHRATINSYIKMAQAKTDVERQEEGKEKTGAFTGVYAINPANDEKIPIWIADFVLAGYGTGAVFGDIHDERDFEFLQKYKIPARVTVIPEDLAEAEKVRAQQYAYTKEGILINSGQFSGLKSADARGKIIDWLSAKGAARKQVNYRLRDWIFSRQHYWGEPIPIIHCLEHGAVAVPDDQLPVELPAVKNYEPTDNGASPLAQIDEWVNTTCPICGKPAKRETDTMPNWAGSSWYYLRYYDPHNDQAFAGSDKLDYWKEVDLYLGGMEHTTLHLLYSRFWHQFLYDQKLVPTLEPYAARRGQGIILAADGTKMSKSKGNIVNPTDIIESGYGADALRLAIAFLAPYDQTTPWSPEAVAGTHRFLQRLWTLIQDFQTADKKDTEIPELQRAVQKTIKKVSDDLNVLNFNTAIAAMMELTNQLYAIKAKQGFVSEFQPALESLLKVLAPFAPHIVEELWRQLGHEDSIHLVAWPKYDEKYLIEDTATIVIQVKGKLRGEIRISRDASEEEVVKAAQAQDKVAGYLKGQTIRKTIFVPNKLVNFVI